MKTTNKKEWPVAIKTIVLAMAGAGLVSLPHLAYANPTDGQVVAGNVTIRQESASKVGITQTTAKGIIDWQKYSIGANEQVQYYQPSASSVTLNRVVGQDPSKILGRLTANGQIFLVNPNGIYFGKNAQVDVAGLVASTHNIRNEDFLAGKYNFNIPGNPGASVINEGTIRIADTGIAAFVAPSVAHRGVIVARLGKVAMAAANGFTLDFHGDQLLSFLVTDEVAKTAFDIDGKQLTSFVENSGRIEAQGGYVLLTAKAAESAIHGVINQSGVIEATTVGLNKGVIILNAGKGSLEVSGTLDASAPNGGDGGFVETSGAKVNIADGTRVTTASATGQTGWWLVDPTDFTIYASGNLPPSSGIAAATLNAMLGITNATIVTSGAGTGNGDIYVNSAVDWFANKLTLSAHGNININANLNAVSTASLALIFGQGALAAGNTSNIITKGAAVNLPSGTNNFTTKQGSDGVVKNYTVITTLGTAGSTTTTDLQGMNGDLTKNYVLGRDIDALATTTWNAGTGFTPVGIGYSGGSINPATAFSGIFDGLGHTISNLTINNLNPMTYRRYFHLGLFGVTNNAILRNVGLIGGSVGGLGPYIGGLVGALSNSTISNSYATGSVVGAASVGGLVGISISASSISNSYSTGSVSSFANNQGQQMGGLVGFNEGSIKNSYATGNVSGLNTVGGLAGVSYGSISNSYATGNVIGTGSSYDFGGLVGFFYGGNISNSYASGNVSGTLNAGGLVGDNYNGRINNSYASGNVSGTTNVGGLVGQTGYGSITNSYVSGNVRGTNSVGGMVGLHWYQFSPTISNNSYYNTQTTGQISSPLGTGLTTTQMQQQASYTGWDFVNTWRIVEGSSYPLLRALTQSVIVVTPDQLGIKANNVTKVYDGVAVTKVTESVNDHIANDLASLSGWNGGITATGLLGSDSLTNSSIFSGALSYGGTWQGAKDAGNYSIIPSGLSSQKYEIVYTNGNLSITPRPLEIVGIAPLTISAKNVSKVYDGLEVKTLADLQKLGFTITAGDTLANGDTLPAIGVPGTGSWSGTLNVTGAGNSWQGAVNANTDKNPYYAIRPRGLSSPNYEITYRDASLIITPATLVLQAVSDAKNYDGKPESDKKPGVFGLVKGDTINGLGQYFENYHVLGYNESTLIPYLIDITGGDMSRSTSNYKIRYEYKKGTIVPNTVIDLDRSIAVKVGNSQPSTLQSNYHGNGWEIRNGKLVAEDRLANMTIDQLKEIQSAISKMPGEKVGFDNSSLYTVIENQKNELNSVNNWSFFSAKNVSSVALVAISETFNFLAAFSPIGQIGLRGIELPTNYFVELANNKKFMSGLDALKLANEPEIFEGLVAAINGSSEISEFSASKTVKIMTLLAQATKVSLEKSEIDAELGFSILSTISKIFAEAWPPGSAAKVGLTYFSAITDACIASTKIENERDKIVAAAQEIINEKYKALYEIENRRLIIGYISENGRPSL